MKMLLTTLALLWGIASFAQDGWLCGLNTIKAVYPMGATPKVTEPLDSVAAGDSVLILIEYGFLTCDEINKNVHTFYFSDYPDYYYKSFYTEDLEQYYYCDPTVTNNSDVYNCNNNLAAQLYLVPFKIPEDVYYVNFSATKLMYYGSQANSDIYLYVYEPVVTATPELSQKEPLEIQVYDLQGKLVSTSLNYADTLFKNRLYVVKTVYTDGSTTTEKIVIQ